jgi:hypothetical protein
VPIEDAAHEGQGLIGHNWAALVFYTIKDPDNFVAPNVPDGAVAKLGVN